MDNTPGCYYFQIGFSGGVSFDHYIAETFVFLSDEVLVT
jgi:hypothetical protein